MTPPFVYLDNNATTVCAPEVVAAMIPYMSASSYGNPSSGHFAGRQAYRAVELAREQLAAILSVGKHELFFNSGATEGNNWIFYSLLKSRPKKRRIVVSSIEHKSVLLTARSLVEYGYEVIELPVTTDGVVDLATAKALITEDTLLVAVQYANNETGVIQPIQQLTELAHRQGALMHCDAVQGLGQATLNISELEVDSASFSAHKIHGPTGVGALYLNHGVCHWPFALPLQGGGQEKQVRPGTLNVPGIVGFGVAADLIYQNLPERLKYMRHLCDILEESLYDNFLGCIIHGSSVPRIANTTNVAIPGISSDILMANLPLICISNGSACNSGAIGGSYVLEAMDICPKEIEESIRVSVSIYNKTEEMELFINRVLEFVEGNTEIL